MLTDRINVGGNESGQQSLYVGPGSGGDQAVWSVDGVVITDMAALGSSPAYYDFDAFEEMQVTTGGSDATIATGGVVLNMVTKRGTNEWRGSGRYLRPTTRACQANLDFDQRRPRPGRPLERQPRPGRLQAGQPDRQRTRTTAPRSAARSSRTACGSGAPTASSKIDLLTINDFSDKTTLKNWNAKLNAQIAPSNSATGFAFNSDKIKIGRNAGPPRPQETTWDQGNFGPEPTAYKVEDTQIFGTNFYLTGMYSKVNGGFQLVPEGGSAARRTATASRHLAQQLPPRPDRAAAEAVQGSTPPTSSTPAASPTS